MGESGTEAMLWSLPLLPLVADAVPPGLLLALGQEGVPVVEASRIADGARRLAGVTAAGRFLLYDSKRDGDRPAARARSRQQCPLDVHALREGWPFDPFEALVSTQSQRLSWEFEGHWLSEQVARHHKAAIRRRLTASLRDMVESHGGIWMKCSAFPYPYRSAFNLRVDHDEYDRDDLDHLIRELEGREDATSHFLCASAFEGNRQVLGRFAGLDVGSHGWWHHTYRDARQNRVNVRRGIEALASAGLEPRGFVSPHGRWNEGLASVLEELKVDYSSEFALAYDELPFLPYVRAGKERVEEAKLRGIELARRGPQAADGGRCSTVLQLPVHPVCLGLFLESGVRDEGTVQRYFDAVIGRKYARAEPVFLYGHPTGRLGRHTDVLRSIFSSAAQFDLLWPTTLSRFARWWRRRNRVRLTVYRAGEGFEVHVSGAAGPERLGLEVWRGNHVAIMPAENQSFQFRPEELAYELRSTGEPAGEPTAVAEVGGLKDQLRRWLDWERVTPDEEIRIDTLPGVLKRGLRRWRRASRR